MKKLIIILSIASLVFGQLIPAAVANAQSNILEKGMSSEEIKAIQQILKEDPSIYPEGYVTGYFGSLTEKAVKRLQEKFGVLVTGVIDEATERIIFPYFDIRVASPNGGEYWERGETQTIRWEVLQPLIEGTEPEVFWPQVSVDLYKRNKEEGDTEEPGTHIIVYRSVFVKHLGFANLFDESFKWKISEDTPNGDNYVIRISMGRKIIPCVLPLDSEGIESCLEESLPEMPIEEKFAPPYYSLVWDESDMPFTISGETPPCPPCSCPVCPTCSCPVCPNVKTSIEILQQVITELARLSKDIEKAIAILKAIPTQ